MKYYNMSIEEVLKKLKTDNNGLNSLEVNKRLKQDGKNELVEKKKESKISKFLAEFKDLMIVILIISAIISFAMSWVNKEPFTDSIIILLIVIINAILGFIQESKADKAIESLKHLQVTKVKVKRDNKIYVVDSEYIVKGDILLLEAGDRIPADARIIKEVSLKVDESSLTGEAVAIFKTTDKLEEQTPLSERSNMIFCGTHIVYGKCEAVVCEIGMNTEFGKIAESLNEEKKEVTPLEHQIDDISRSLSMVVMGIIALIFMIGLFKNMEIMQIFMLSISLAVAAIPEGLPAVITITLSLGMSELAKRKAIVRKLSSVETLGCTEVICSDKTGTITQNKMTVLSIYYDKKIQPISTIDSNILFEAMALNNDTEKTNNKYIGEPTENALYECAEKYIDIYKLRKNNIRVDELPFDSDRKMMSTINKGKTGYQVYTKGSFDSIIKHCTYIYENDKVIKLTAKRKKELKQIENEQANNSYRILAYAYKNIDSDYVVSEKLENDLIFIGLALMMDPPRDDVKLAIKNCQKAHIKPVMITGDSLGIAKAIAKDIGILKNDDEAITGEDIDNMSAAELKKNVKNYSVYARVSPVNKLAIVKAWQQNGKVVAMTGDGVNDAPALKQADIGVGMGITGTEVSKGVSDIVLADDSFSTIVKAVEEGRRIFDNIRNVLIYLLTGNIAEVFVVFIGMLFGIEIFLPIQLLYINLITDGIPAIALAFEPADKDVMNRNVRKKNKNFFTPFLISKTITSAILKTIAILWIFVMGYLLFSLEVAATMAFLTLVLSEMIFAFSCRNLKRNVIDKDIFKNSYLNKCMLFLSFIQLLVFITPIKNIFNLTSLNLLQISYCFIVTALLFVFDELSKSRISKKFKD